MIILFYACLAGGAMLLLAAMRGQLTAAPRRVRRLRAIGVVTAAAPGLAPLLAWSTGRLEVSWPFPVIAIGFTVAFAAIVAGLLVPVATSISVALRRFGFLVLLLLGALPSWALLLLAPAILVAGLTLVEPRRDGALASQVPRQTS